LVITKRLLTTGITKAYWPAFHSAGKRILSSGVFQD